MATGNADVPANTSAAAATPGLSTNKPPLTVAPSDVQTPPAGVSDGSTAAGEAPQLAQPIQSYKRHERLREQESLAASQILPKAKLHDLVRQINPDQMLETEVEELLLEMTNDFIERVVTFSCQLAKHRGSDTLEAKDVQLHLQRNWNIRVPGAGREDLRIPKSHRAADAHKSRLAAVQKDAERVEQAAAKKRKVDESR